VLGSSGIKLSDPHSTQDDKHCLQSNSKSVVPQYIILISSLQIFVFVFFNYVKVKVEVSIKIENCALLGCYAAK